jgi:hypothetical protein
MTSEMSTAASAIGATPTTADLIAMDEEARQRHGEIRLLLIAILVVSIVGVVFLAWDAID